MASEEKIEYKDIRSPNQIINTARKTLVAAASDIRTVLVEWAADPHRAATDISVNELMQAHIFIANAIRGINNAQHHTQE